MRFEKQRAGLMTATLVAIIGMSLAGCAHNDGFADGRERYGRRMLGVRGAEVRHRRKDRLRSEVGRQNDGSRRCRLQMETTAAASSITRREADAG